MTAAQPIVPFPPAPARVRLSDVVEVDAFAHVDDFLDALACLRVGLVANHNLHSVHVALTDRGYREALASASLIHADGWPIAKWAGVVSRQPCVRLGYRDWTGAFLTRLRPGSRVALLGARLDENRRALGELATRFPGVVFVGVDGYRPPRSYPAWVAAQKPGHVFVGLGMGRQERVAIDCLRAWPAVYFCAGGWIKQAARMEAPAPDWVVGAHMEWAWRLCQDPRGKWRRYLVEPWTVAVHIARSSLWTPDDAGSGG